MSTHLILALDAPSWGRITLGIGIARELRRRGDRVVFVAHTRAAPLIRTSHFQVEELADHLGPLTQSVVELCIETESPRSIVLCDFHSCSRYLELHGVDPRFVLDHGIPVIGMDIWNCRETADQMDVVGGATVARATGIEELAGTLVPVPIGRPSATGAYCALGRPAHVVGKVRRHIRRNLGLGESDRAVLFCTAGWQHNVTMPAGQRLFEAVSRLLWAYVKELGPAVRLVHIGPAALPLDAPGERYLWMPSVTPDIFDRLLGSVDLLLSANISATTIGRAMASGVPVLVVQNSCRAESREAVGALSPGVSAWLEGALPLYPFRLWPLGYWDFLAPLLRGNPYCEGLEVVELLDELAFTEACRRLLFDRTARELAMARQAAYAAQVRELPSAAQLLTSYLRPGARSHAMPEHSPD